MAKHIRALTVGQIDLTHRFYQSLDGTPPRSEGQYRFWFADTEENRKLLDDVAAGGRQQLCQVAGHERLMFIRRFEDFVAGRNALCLDVNAEDTEAIIAEHSQRAAQTQRKFDQKLRSSPC